MKLIYIKRDNKLYKLNDEQYQEYWRRIHSEIFSEEDLIDYVVLNGFQVEVEFL